MVEVILGFHVGEDRRKSVLLEDRRGAQGALQAMHLVRPDHAPECAEGFPMLFTIVRQRLEPPLHLFRRIGGVDDRSFSRGERRPGRCGTPAMFEAFAALLDFLLVPVPVLWPRLTSARSPRIPPRTACNSSMPRTRPQRPPTKR